VLSSSVPAGFREHQEHVVYRADQRVNDVFELFAARLSGPGRGSLARDERKASLKQ